MGIRSSLITSILLVAVQEKYRPTGKELTWVDKDGHLLHSTPVPHFEAQFRTSSPRTVEHRIGLQTRQKCVQVGYTAQLCVSLLTSDYKRGVYIFGKV